MPVREVRDRRGRSERGRSGLLEREEALLALDQLLDAAAAGSGEALMFVAHAGMGKTRLHEAALDAARTRGFAVLRGAAAELETDLAFGVTTQVIRSGLADLDAAERDALVETMPPHVRALAGRDNRGLEQLPFGRDLTIAHGAFDAVAAIAETRPVLLAIDDLQWSDEASLEFLLYVLHRVDELSAALLLTLRSSAAGGQSAALDHILAHPRLEIMRLEPLGRPAVGQLLERALPERFNQALLDVCYEVTAGNPFYLHELLLALADERRLDSDALAEHARSLAPDAVTRSLRVRVGRLGDHAARLARAIAVLGDDVELRHAARLAGLSVAEASRAADALASVEVLLAREPLRFVHPLVRHAVEVDIPASEVATRHLDAARLLEADGARPGQIAAHLLVGRAEGDEWVVTQLRRAAEEARASAAPGSAVSYLRRALAEPPPPAQRADVLAELGIAEAVLVMPEAVSRLEQAAAETPDPIRRARLELERGHALRLLGRQEDAAAAYEQGLRELESAPGATAERELHDELEGGLLGAGSMVGALQAATMQRAQRVLAEIGEQPRTDGHRLLLAHAALNASFAGETAAAVSTLATRAWDGGQLLKQERAEGMGWSRVSAAFALSGELERAVEVSEAAREDARVRASPLAFATACYMLAVPQLWRGQLNDAVADLEQARDAQRYGWRHFVRGAAAQYALCLIELGELERAEQVLDEAPLQDPDDLEDAIRLCALATLRTAQARNAEALEIALHAGREIERHVQVLGYCPWRTIAADAALADGRATQALELAQEALTVAERTRVPHDRIRALRVLGKAQGGSAGTATLEQAVGIARSLPPRLEGLRAMVDLGAALRRANRRTEARDVLVEAADLTHRGGLNVLHDGARTEMAAAGARPRRDILLTGPEALTPSERRIAGLAAEGLSNRAIAQALFVTPKTVEYHLRNTYRKLGITTRQELAPALTAA